jgi:hypothetical protein
VANKNPEVCEFAFYHHYIQDVMNISSKLKLDWSLNKGWREVGAFLSGPFIVCA